MLTLMDLLAEVQEHPLQKGHLDPQKPRRGQQVLGQDALEPALVRLAVKPSTRQKTVLESRHLSNRRDNGKLAMTPDGGGTRTTVTVRIRLRTADTMNLIPRKERALLPITQMIPIEALTCMRASQRATLQGLMWTSRMRDINRWEGAITLTTTLNESILR